MIEVISQPGVGSTFSFYIPIPPTATTCSPAIEQLLKIHPFAIHSIAVVDDQKSNRQLTAMCLHRLHYEVGSQFI